MNHNKMMNHQSNKSGNQILNLSNGRLLSDIHLNHYVGMLKLDGMHKMTEIKIMHAAEKRRISCLFQNDDIKLEKESRDIASAKMYLLHRIMYWNASN